jgi:hypothetical protein
MRHGLREGRPELRRSFLRRPGPKLWRRALLRRRSELRLREELRLRPRLPQAALLP